MANTSFRALIAVAAFLLAPRAALAAPRPEDVKIVKFLVGEGDGAVIPVHSAYRGSARSCESAPLKAGGEMCAMDRDSVVWLGERPARLAGSDKDKTPYYNGAVLVRRAEERARDAKDQKIDLAFLFSVPEDFPYPFWALRRFDHDKARVLFYYGDSGRIRLNRRDGEMVLLDKKDEPVAVLVKAGARGLQEKVEKDLDKLKQSLPGR